MTSIELMRSCTLMQYGDVIDVENMQERVSILKIIMIKE